MRELSESIRQHKSGNSWVEDECYRLDVKAHQLKHDGVYVARVPVRAELETPSAKARWYLKGTVVVVRLNLKLHRLKPDGI